MTEAYQILFVICVLDLLAFKQLRITAILLEFF